MISSSQVHIFTILSNIFNSFPGNVLATKAKSSESDCCPFAACCRMGRERKMKSRTCSLATMYISTRLFVCKKKCPSLPVTPLVSHSGMATYDPLELKTLVS